MITTYRRNLFITSICLVVLLLSTGIIWANSSDYQLGLKHFREGKYEKATTKLVSAVSKNPDQMYPHYILGLTYYKLNKYDFAETQLKKAYDINSDHYRVMINLGRVYLKRNKTKEAVEVAKEAIEVKSKEDGYHILGRAYMSQGNLEEAINNLEKAVELNSKNYYILNNLVHIPEIITRSSSIIIHLSFPLSLI
jgi:tetratricopeptide (TPR) repeat protein